MYRNLIPSVENLESKLLLDGALTSTSLVSTTSALVAPAPTQVQSQPAAVPVSYVPPQSLASSVAAPDAIAAPDNAAQQTPLAPVNSVAPAPAPVDVVPADSFVGPPPAYTGYPGIYTLNPNYPFGGYNPVYAEVPPNPMVSSTA